MSSFIPSEPGVQRLRWVTNYRRLLRVSVLAVLIVASNAYGLATDPLGVPQASADTKTKTYTVRVPKKETYNERVAPYTRTVTAFNYKNRESQLRVAPYTKTKQVYNYRTTCGGKWGPPNACGRERVAPFTKTVPAYNYITITKRVRVAPYTKRVAAYNYEQRTRTVWVTETRTRPKPHTHSCPPGHHLRGHDQCIPNPTTTARGGKPPTEDGRTQNPTPTTTARGGTPPPEDARTPNPTTTARPETTLICPPGQVPQRRPHGTNGYHCVNKTTTTTTTQPPVVQPVSATCHRHGSYFVNNECHTHPTDNACGQSVWVHTGKLQNLHNTYEVTTSPPCTSTTTSPPTTTTSPPTTTTTTTIRPPAWTQVQVVTHATRDRVITQRKTGDCLIDSDFTNTYINQAKDRILGSVKYSFKCLAPSNLTTFVIGMTLNLTDAFTGNQLPTGWKGLKFGNIFCYIENPNNPAHPFTQSVLTETDLDRVFDPSDESWGCATEADIELVDNNLYVQVSINRFFEVEINSTNQQAVVTRRLQGGGTLGNELYIWWSPFTVNDHLSITTDGGDNGDLGGNPGRLNRRRLAESVTTTTTTVPPTTTTTTTTTTLPPTTTTTTTTVPPTTTTTTTTVPVPSLPVVSRLPAWDNGSYRPVTYSNIPSVPSSCTPWVYWQIRPGMTRLIALCPR